MKMRFRTDGWHYADLKAAGETFESHYLETDPWRTDPVIQKYWAETPKAEPGDVWRIHWYHRDENDVQLDDWIAGYAICCIGCSRVHCWTTALNCAQKTKEGSCVHSEAHGSCWSWSGSAEEGTLTASPSLQVVADRCPWHCGWHGYIQAGDIHV